MKIISLVLILFGINVVSTCGQISKQNHKKSLDLILCGQIKEILIEKNKEQVEYVAVVIDFQLINKGSDGIIIIPDRVKVLGSAAYLENGFFLTNYGSIGPSTPNSFEQTKKNYDKPNPKINGVYLIKPNELWKFSRTLNLSLDRPMTNPHAAWAAIKQNSPFNLKVKIETVDSYLVNNGKLTKGEDFWLKLQERWSKYGYLWIDDIVSEPIELDLSSVVVKTESQP